MNLSRTHHRYSYSMLSKALAASRASIALKRTLSVGICIFKTTVLYCTVMLMLIDLLGIKPDCSGCIRF